MPMPTHTHIRIDQIARPARPSMFGEATDLDTELDRLDAEAEQQEHRHDPAHRRLKLLSLAACAVIGAALWILALVGLGALSRSADTARDLQPQPITHTTTRRAA